jgi:uncharacterized protein (TIGR02444 family)
MNVPENDRGFWDFSLRLYGRPGVPAACLALQDEGGADVNLVLFLLYLADCGRMLDAAAVADLDQATRDWREHVVKPLRGVRRLLKTDIGAFTVAATAAFRDDMKRMELAAEQLQQFTLTSIAPPASAGATASSRRLAAAHHLADYAQLCTLPAAQGSGQVPAQWPEEALHALIDAWADDATARGPLE